MIDFLNKLLEILSPATTRPEPVTIFTPKGSGVSGVLVRKDYEFKEVEAPPAIPCRKHIFASLTDLADWLRRHGNPAICEVLVQVGLSSIEVRAVQSNSWTPTFLVGCSVPYSEEWKAWQDFAKLPRTQQELYQFARLHRGDFNFDEGKVLMGTLRKLAVTGKGSSDVQINEAGMVEFTSREKGIEIKGNLPLGFKLFIPIFAGAGLSRYHVEVDLVPQPGPENTLVFALVFPDREAMVRGAAEDAVALLRASLNRDGDGDDPWLVGLGTLNPGI